jgi:hypothetical protein
MQNCPHQIDCLAVVWAVLIQAGDTNSLTEDNFPSEISQFNVLRDVPQIRYSRADIRGTSPNTHPSSRISLPQYGC